MIELQAIRLERLGHLPNRYLPLLVLEAAKSALKLSLWSGQPAVRGRMFVRHPTPQDLDQMESELGVQVGEEEAVTMMAGDVQPSSILPL